MSFTTVLEGFGETDNGVGDSTADGSGVGIIELWTDSDGFGVDTRFENVGPGEPLTGSFDGSSRGVLAIGGMKVGEVTREGFSLGGGGLFFCARLVVGEGGIRVLNGEGFCPDRPEDEKVGVGMAIGISLCCDGVGVGAVQGVAIAPPKQLLAKGGCFSPAVIS